MNYHFISLIIDKLVSFIECSFVDIQIILNSKSINDEKLTKDFLDMLRLMERKFLHMLQVIDIAINLSEVNHYESYQQIANILIATFHDYLFLTHWVEKYISHVRNYLSGDNRDKMEEIEAECIDFLRKKQSHNINASKIGYKVFIKK